MKKKTIFICLCLERPLSVVFSKITHNPGIGGTPFTCIRFAFYLAELMPDSKIILVTNQKQFLINTDLTNLSTMSVNNFDDFFENSVNGHSNVIVISPKHVLAKVSSYNLEIASSKVIAWSRHPFDFGYPLTKIKFAACVCVGAYQYYSNQFIHSPLWFIPLIFFSPVSNGNYYICQLSKTDNIKIVYLGALVEAKGFLWVAKEWKKIKSNYPNASLHVIGSVKTYGIYDNIHPVIPALNGYAKQILNYIDLEDIQAGRVIFYGNLGVEKFNIIKNCHVGILNPTGETEAFCSSAVEILSCGVPLISSNDYGMFETMRFFPELSLKKPSDIVFKLDYLFRDSDTYYEFRQRAFFVGKYFHNQNHVIMAKWVRLINLVKKGVDIKCEPPLNKLNYGNGRYTLIYRKYRTWVSTNFPGYVYLRKLKNFFKK